MPNDKGVKAVLARLRDLPAPPAFLSALAVSFCAMFALGTGVLGASEPGQAEPLVEKPGQYPATKRVEVASGTLPGIGAYRLLHSRDYKGGMCIALELATAGIDGGPDLSEGCGGPEEMNVGKVTAADGSWTIAHGKLPEKAQRARVRKADGQVVALPVIQDDKGIDGKFTVKKLEGRLGAVEFEADDANGSTLKKQDFAP
jgi:hypothetical protein